MRTKIAIVFLAFLTSLVMILPVYAGVENVNISPLVLVAGKSITFYGGATGSSVDNQIEVVVFVGLDCQSNNVFASTYTVANSSDIYSVTLSFPVDLEYSGWKLEQPYQQFQAGLPAGDYSVGVVDAASIANGSGGICRNFTIGAQPVPEFTWIPIALVLTLGLSLCLMRSKRRVSLRE
jgi:hypothetical protein